MHIVHMRMVGTGGKDIHTRVVYTVYTVYALEEQMFVITFAQKQYMLCKFFLVCRL